MQRRTFLAGSAALAGATFAATPFAFAQGKPETTKVAIAVGGKNLFYYLPLTIAERRNYFKDEGLDVEILSQPAGVDAENELLAGAVQGVVGFYDHTIDLQSKGKEVQALVIFGQVPGEVEMVATKSAETFKSMADSKGKTLGVTGLGSSTSFLTQYLAQRAGVPSTQYTLLPVGADNSFIAAIKQNRIDAGMTTEPTVSQLLKTGDAKVLVDMRTLEGTRAALGGTYPASSFYVQRAWAESHKDDATKLSHAFAKTLNFIATHSAEEIAAKMPKDYYGNNKDLYVGALKASLPMFTKDGKMPADGPDTVLKVLSAFNPSVKGKHIDLAKTYSNDYVSAAVKTAAK